MPCEAHTGSVGAVHDTHELASAVKRQALGRCPPPSPAMAEGSRHHESKGRDPIPLCNPCIPERQGNFSPVGGCALEGGRCQRISTALHMVSEEMGMGSNSGMSTRPPTTTMQSCRPMAACHSLATGMQPSAISGDHLRPTDGCETAEGSSACSVRCWRWAHSAFKTLIVLQTSGLLAACHL